MIPGCTYIYSPKGQAGEYAPLAFGPDSLFATIEAAE